MEGELAVLVRLLGLLTRLLLENGRGQGRVDKVVGNLPGLGHAGGLEMCAMVVARRACAVDERRDVETRRAVACAPRRQQRRRGSGCGNDLRRLFVRKLRVVQNLWRRRRAKTRWRGCEIAWKMQKLPNREALRREKTREWR